MADTYAADDTLCQCHELWRNAPLGYLLQLSGVYDFWSYADLYGVAMFLYSDLLNAHRANDMAVMEAYGFFMEPTPEHPSKWYSPSETVAALMKMYQELTEKSNG